MDEDQIGVWFARIVAAYALISVICFGPATVQSERTYEASRTQCLTEREGDNEGKRACKNDGVAGVDGIFKALFWPLWLSYLAAERLMPSSTPRA